MTLLQITDKMTEFFPAILKFGITGLSAIVFLLAYFLLKTQNKKDKPNSNMLKTIKSFMWIALVFAILSATSSFVDGYYVKKAISSDNEKNTRTEVLADMATEEVYSTYDEIDERHSFKNGNLTKGGEHDDLEDDNLRKDTSNKFIQPMSEDEFKYRAMKQAIFKNIYFLGADKSILDSVITRLSFRLKLNNELQVRIKSIFQELLITKFEWLKNEAIPTARKKLDDLNGRSVDQDIPTAVVLLPKTVWIFDEYPEYNQPQIRIRSSDLTKMYSELEILKKQLK